MPISTVMLMGSKRLDLRCLEEMHRLSPETLSAVMTIDDRSDSRSVFDEICTFAARNAIALLMLQNRRESEEIIRSLKPDL